MKQGRIIAQLLATEWTQAPLISGAGLAQVTPMVLHLGGAAWAWRQVRQTSLKETPAAQELQQAYRLHALHVAIKEREIIQVLTCLQSQGFDPLMGKGWAIARQYPEPGLRPFGDIDLYVPQAQYAAFRAALPAELGALVDWHKGAAELDDRSFADLYAHSLQVPLGDLQVRTFGTEDHLRLLCLHFLREGALRPLWLCDIAVAINSLPRDFDWDYCLRGDARRTEGVICTIGLAHQLLGVNIGHLPIAKQAMNLPRWLVPTVLRLWGQGKRTKGRRLAMSAYLRHPRGILQALQERWPNAVEATFGVKGRFNNWPRLPYQLGECVIRTTNFVRRLPELSQKY